MEKLKLRIETLAVDTFAPEPADRAKGGVRGYAATQDFRCNSYFCSYGSCTGLPC